MKGASNLAVLRGRTSIYTYVKGPKVLLIKDDYKHTVTSVESFEHLFYQLDGVTTALKEDCIEYTIHHPNKPMYYYPQWYINAYTDGLIWEDDYGGYLFDDPSCEIPMAPNSIVVKNHLGHLKYMERNEFQLYYEVIGGLENEF